MLEAQQVEELITLVCAMDRQALKRQFLSFRGDFPIDFTAEFLDTMPVDRLRHIYVALCLQVQKIPTGNDPISSAA